MPAGFRGADYYKEMAYERDARECRMFGKPTRRLPLDSLNALRKAKLERESQSADAGGSASSGVT